MPIEYVIVIKITGQDIFYLFTFLFLKDSRMCSCLDIHYIGNT